MAMHHRQPARRDPDARRWVTPEEGQACRALEEVGAQQQCQIRHFAERIVRDFDRELPRFWQVVPKELLDKLPVPVTAAEATAALTA